METALAAYRTLVSLALSDGRLDAKERDLLERYRTALGVPAGAVDLRVFDVGGRIVRTLAAKPYGAGRHRVSWDGRAGDGRDLAPGLYFVRLHTPDSMETRKLVRVR